MSDGSTIERFEELEAGRALGDLDLDEIREWEKIREGLGASPDLSLELTAAALEVGFLQAKEPTLPEGLAKRLRSEVIPCGPSASRPDADNVIVRPAFWKRVRTAKETPWAIAAILTALLAVSFLTNPPSPSPEVARKQLEQEARDLLRLSFDGLGDYLSVEGEVLWSDEKQEGYMTLSNLPANDPKVNQYQLWIVDPSRDDKPVDGGVFDIPTDESTAVVRIRNPLAVSNPQAFVITLEKPGGVVVSKQEVVVALAKTS